MFNSAKETLLSDKCYPEPIISKIKSYLAPHDKLKILYDYFTSALKLFKAGNIKKFKFYACIIVDVSVIGDLVSWDSVGTLIVFTRS